MLESEVIDNCPATLLSFFDEHALLSFLQTGDAVFIDIDKNYTYLRADKNIDGDFSDSGDDVDYFANAMWMFNYILKGSAVENAHIKIMDNDEAVSVGSVLEPDSTYFKLFIQKSYYN